MGGILWLQIVWKEVRADSLCHNRSSVERYPPHREFEKDRVATQSILKYSPNQEPKKYLGQEDHVPGFGVLSEAVSQQPSCETPYFHGTRIDECVASKGKMTNWEKN